MSERLTTTAMGTTDPKRFNEVALVCRKLFTSKKNTFITNRVIHFIRYIFSADGKRCDPFG